MRHCVSVLKKTLGWVIMYMECCVGSEKNIKVHKNGVKQFEYNQEV